LLFVFQDGGDDDGGTRLPNDLLNVEDTMSHMRYLQNTNFNYLIGGLRMKPFSKSRVSIPLCRLISLPIVRPILAIDVQLLENEFVNGYRKGDRVLYVSSYDKDGNTMDIRDEDTWREHWQSSNKLFEKILKNDKDYERFCAKMFFVWEGNHRVTVWRHHIDKVHGEDKKWHYSVDCIDT
jgi:hypothetical protein